MHGNVWEWCADWYDEGYYANSPADDPAGPSEGRERVVRGGSWASARALCGTKNRFGGRPHNLSYDRGFRVVAVHVDDVGKPVDQSARDGAPPGRAVGTSERVLVWPFGACYDDRTTRNPA